MHRSGSDDEDPGNCTGEVEASVFCPYCGEGNSITIDSAGGSVQQYVEDCRVCCRPWHIVVRIDGRGSASVDVRTDDD